MKKTKSLRIVNLSFSVIEKTFLETKIDEAWVISWPFDKLTKRMKVGVSGSFEKLEPNAFEDWLTTIKDYFEWFDVLEDRKVHYIRMKLRVHARAQRGSLEEKLHRTQHPLISRLVEMKKQMKEKYLLIDYEKMMFEEMLQLRQGSLTVDQYTNHFHDTAM
jgi:hypothetical protein